jgi:hypothetical protein
MNVSKRTAVLFVKTARRIQKVRPVHFLGGANTVGWNSMVPRGDPWYTAYLVGTREPGRKESSPMIGRAWPCPEREKSDHRQKHSASPQAAHPT